ncbi:hypothetical protein LOZ12_000490 [Ophidiomyces ophidiicola]|uniref:Uncharacterized protein n=1 Tax=Ophidiomyces ophidiicola TaxID=1387563 RepID=A0ACB8V5E2_9EURO|nr:hypothetical protein LOZ64_000400 [Ophidiomyces ophidiicola]KAI1955664.1 hypothetical protein LOZ62_000215 [Ophidiomyces ophidiicola]KAI1975960.1 hypothetical protein LOZ56_000277 [Ophidiomyces ophidiicola]KAI2011393.1 hypothetical protein LOZ50_000753 [Ophidiomyces ophidiicola]KAI2015262.1 hypothetical protein LOZ46_005287 [Ophidiomyces ophidiicola]
MDAFATTLAARFYSSAPAAQTKMQTNPTLLVSWWATGFSLAIIFVRLFGRYIRTERLFAEDWVMALSILPLLIRMGFVHVVLLWGTNNAVTTGLSDEDLYRREIGSKMVIGARIFYALFIWTAKFTVTSFFKRLIAQIWRRSFQHVLLVIRYYLAFSFLAVLIAIFTECQPFYHYWQVVPDPGPQCRQSYAQLITMGACAVMADLLLVAFPIPIIYLSAMPTKRKVSLTLLFGLSLILVAITCYRVTSVISRQGSQQYRSLIASLEILAASAVSNAIVIGSFVRDRGLKKQKFKAGSLSESIEQSSSRRATITHHHWGSDADLVGDLGIRLDPELRSPSYQKIRPAPMALPSAHLAKRGSIDPNWQFSFSKSTADDDRTSASDSLGGLKVHPHEYIETNFHPSPKDATMPPPSYLSLSKVSLNDVGGLLDPPSPTDLTCNYPPSSHPYMNSHDQRTRGRSNPVNGLISPSPTYAGSSQSSLSRTPTHNVRNFSRPSTAHFAGRVNSADTSSSPPSPTDTRQWSARGPNRSPDSDNMPELQDLGGLLRRDNDLERNDHPPPRPPTT